MLKTIVTTLSVLATGATLFAQGTVNFSTRAVDAVVLPGGNDTRVRVGSASGAFATGTGFWIQLYAANGTTATEGQLTAVGTPVNFRGGSFAGWNQTTGTTAAGTTVDPVVQVTTVNGGPVTLQLRAWEGGVGSRYEDAANRGFSDLLRYAATGAPGGAPPIDLVGLNGFVIVPEPSTIALAVLGGLGTLVLFRRRKN